MERVQMLEGVLSQKLQWRLLLPTPVEFIRQLLHIANDEVDFTNVIVKANNYSTIAFVVYKISAYPPSTIALGSLFLALKKMEYNDFLEGLKGLITQRGFGFDLDGAIEC